MYAFIVGFNEWVLKGWVAGQSWKRSKSKGASGWEHDGQIIRRCRPPPLYSLGLYPLWSTYGMFRSFRQSQSCELSGEPCALAILFQSTFDWS